MKKIVSVGAVICLMLAASGCTKTPGTSKPGTTSSPSSSTPAPSTSSSIPPSSSNAAAAAKTGLGTVANVASSKSATSDTGPSAQADVVVCSVSLDSTGKILSVSIDSLQPKVAYDTKGKLKTDLAAEVKSKKELGTAYGMKKASAIGKEWDEQIKALEGYMVGKTVADVKSMKVTKKDGKTIADVQELKSSCTIDITNYVKALEKAATNAK